MWKLDFYYITSLYIYMFCAFYLMLSNFETDNMVASARAKMFESRRELHFQLLMTAEMSCQNFAIVLEAVSGSAQLPNVFVSSVTAAIRTGCF